VGRPGHRRGVQRRVGAADGRAVRREEPRLERGATGTPAITIGFTGRSITEPIGSKSRLTHLLNPVSVFLSW
jgi:hypothetical protein